MDIRCTLEAPLPDKGEKGFITIWKQRWNQHFKINNSHYHLREKDGGTLCHLSLKTSFLGLQVSSTDGFSTFLLLCTKLEKLKLPFKVAASKLMTRSSSPGIVVIDRAEKLGWDFSLKGTSRVLSELCPLRVSKTLASLHRTASLMPLYPLI